MGETMGVICRSQKHATNLLSFLDENWKDYCDQVGYPTLNQSGSPFWKGKLTVETKYTAFRTLGRELVWVILRWAALKVGRRKSAFPNLAKPDESTFHFDEPVPYTLYGNYSPWPVLLETQNPDLNWCLVNEVGVLMVPTESINLVQTVPGYNNIIQQLRTGKLSVPTNMLFDQWTAIQLKDEIVEATKPIQAAMEKLNDKWEISFGK